MESTWSRPWMSRMLTLQVARFASLIPVLTLLTLIYQVMMLVSGADDIGAGQWFEVSNDSPCTKLKSGVYVLTYVNPCPSTITT